MAASRPTIAVDNGSGFIKCGFAGEEEPRAVLPASGLLGASSTRPLRAGIVQDWDQMETYWDHAFTNMLQIDTEQVNLMVTAHMFETKDNRERLVQSLFESFAAPAVFCAAPPVFELYAAGRENGVVLGCGEQVTYAVLVHEGLPDPRTLLRSKVAGEALTEWTARALKESAGEMDAPLARRLKEQLGTLLPADGQEGQSACEQNYTLPDGRTLTASAALCSSLAEPLLTPALLGGVQGGGLIELVSECIRLRDRDGALESDQIGRDGTASWYANVVLAGGSSLFAGIETRLVQGLQKHAPAHAQPQVVAPPQRQHAAWLGASILGSLSTMQQMWISKEEYDENGPLIIHRKCFL